MRSLILAASIASLLSTLSFAAQPRAPRVWTLPENEQAELTLVRVDGGTVELQQATGESLIVALDKLGEADQRYVADEVKLLWARIVLDAEVMSPLTLQLIELFGSAASGAEGPFAQGITPMQMGGQQGLTPARLAEKYGVPQRRLMEAGDDKGVDYIVYGPLAVGSKGDDDRVTWLRVDRKLAADGLKKSAEAALGIASTAREPRGNTTAP
jgi:hypothetical protein